MTPLDFFTLVLVILKTVFDLLRFFIYIAYVFCEKIYRHFDPIPMKSLIGEVILVTGAGNGIGQEICRKLSRTGATLVLWDINKKDNDRTLQELKETGTRAFAYDIDVTDRSQVESLASKVKKEVGEVSIVINNAGIMPCHSFLGHNPQTLEKVFQVNVLAHFWILREFLPSMIERNRGHIATLCSAAGVVGARNLVPYCGTKFAVHGYLEALRDEIAHMPGKPDIKITTIYPTGVNTGLLNNVAKYESKLPALLSVLEPSDVAEKLVEGIRRNAEYVYVPGTVGAMASILVPLPAKVQRFAASLADTHVVPLVE